MGRSNGLKFVFMSGTACFNPTERVLPHSPICTTVMIHIIGIQRDLENFWCVNIFGGYINKNNLNDFISLQQNTNLLVMVFLPSN